jgi:hypothetical protein
LTEYAGFKVGDWVRLNIVAVPPDHRARIISLNNKKVFTVMLKSKGTRDANGKWIAWAEEMEHIPAEFEGLDNL